METLTDQIDLPPSQAVAADAESGGRAASQRHLCLLEVWKQPGRTAAEIARTACLKRHIPSRRLPELRRAGRVRNGVERACSVTGHSSLTWLPTCEIDGRPSPANEHCDAKGESDEPA